MAEPIATAEPYKAVPTKEGKYGVIRVDTGLQVSTDFDFLTLAEIHALEMNNLVEQAKAPKQCAVDGAIFTGPGRLCGGYHSRAEIREAYGASIDDEV